MNDWKTILLVEDDEDLREVVRITLERPGVQILEADDGEAALEIARKQLPTVILLDWMMPGMDGLDVLRELREDPRTETICVVMLTARNRSEDVRSGLAAGADAYLVKPFSPLELVKVVDKALAGEAAGEMS